MGDYTKIKKYRTKFADNECRIPKIEESRFIGTVNYSSRQSFQNLCLAKHNKRGNPFGNKKGVIPIECRGCPIGEEINAGKDVLPVNINA